MLNTPIFLIYEFIEEHEFCGGKGVKYPGPAGGSTVVTSAKASWPEVVAMSVEKAKEIILKDKADVEIEVLPVNAWVT